MSESGLSDHETMTPCAVVLIEGRHERVVTILHPPAGPPVVLRNILTGRTYYRTMKADVAGRPVYQMTER